MAFQILDWAHLTGQAIDALPREHTVVLVTGSPLEVHGPHLPAITDIAEAEALTERVAQRMHAAHPELHFVRLPPIYVSADVLPHVGSLKFRQSTIIRVYEDLGRSLARQGFKHIWVSGFHGGPRHFTSIEVAAARTNRRYGARMISTFSLLMTWLTGGRSDLSELLGERMGITKEDLKGDAHGGCIETSIMLHVLGHHVDPVWRTTGPNTVERWLARTGKAPLTFREPPTPPQLFRMFREKLKFYEAETWSGNPSLASPELGALYLDLLAEQGFLAMDEVWTGKRSLAECHSPVWRSRWIFTSDLLTTLFERALDYRNRVW